jgi:hypothetical protein
LTPRRRIGRGPRGGELVSVAAYVEKHSDAMRDPEIVFEVVAGGWHPVSIQMDYTGHYREAVFVGGDGRISRASFPGLRVNLLPAR